MAPIARGQELAALHQEMKQNKIRPVYLFYGDEEFLISQALEIVQKPVLKGIPTGFNFDVYYGKESDAQRIVDCAMTMPVMAPHRVVVVKDVFDVKGKGLGLLAKYLSKPSPSTIFIMTGGAPRKGRGTLDGEDEDVAPAPETSAKGGKGGTKAQGTPNQLIAAAKKTGMVLELRTYYEKQLRPWIRGEVGRLGKRIDERCVTYLLDMVGENLRELHSEIQKVSIYVGDRQAITMDDLQSVVSDVSAEAVFEFTNATGFKDAGKALLQLSKMFESDPANAASKVIGMLQRHFEQLYRIRCLLDEQVPPGEIARAVGVKETLVWKWEKEALVQARRRSRQELVFALRLLYESTLALRTSRVPPVFQLEGLVMQLCR